MQDKSTTGTPPTSSNNLRKFPDSALRGVVNSPLSSDADRAAAIEILLGRNVSTVGAEPLQSDGEKPGLSKSAAGLASALEALSIAVRWNLRSQRTEWQWGEFFGDLAWHSSTDRLQAAIIERIAERFQPKRPRSDSDRTLQFGADKWQQSLNALLHSREIDPFLSWLEELPSWDQVGRLNALLAVCFTVSPEQNTELIQWVSRYPIMGAVKRTLEPGSKLDVLPVLIGNQGLGKSLFLRSLLPAEFRDDGFSDSLSLNSDPKVRAESLQGRILVEVGEMSGSTRAELESLKAFLSRQDDGGARLSYRRDPEPLPRRCVMVGTTNRRDCLPNDPSGTRRFAVCELSAGDPSKLIDTLDAMRTQIWAEALHRVRSGEQVWLGGQLEREAATANEGYRNADLIVEDLVATLDPDSDLPLAALMEQCGIDKERLTLDGRLPWRFARALEGAGWRQRRTRVHGNKNPVRSWRMQ